MAGLLNWPPSRGPNPHIPQIQRIPGKVRRMDLPAPKKREVEIAERELLSDLEASEAPTMQFSGVEAPVLGEPRKKRPLSGMWKVWYQVVDVASLTVDQAHRLLHGKRVEPDEYDFDFWGCFEFEPRTLWVDITYPLGRGVRLTVPPMVEKRRWPAKGDRKWRTQETMSIGYFMWCVAKEYERIYRYHERYKVWGHDIGDLGFEIIEVEEDGIVRLGIGS